MRIRTRTPFLEVHHQAEPVDSRTLQQMPVNHRHRDIGTRAAGLMLPGDVLSAPKAAGALEVSVQSIYNRSRLWKEQVWSAVRPWWRSPSCVVRDDARQGDGSCTRGVDDARANRETH